MTMRSRCLLAAAATLSLSACFGGETPSELLTLTATEARPAGARSANPGEAMTVVQPGVPEALQTQRIPVYVTPTTIQYLKDAQWVDYPSALFRHILSETIAARTGRVVLDPFQSTFDPGTRLTGQLQMFGLDPARMEAVVVYDAAVARTGAAVVTNRFEARVPVAAADRANVVPALNEAANRVSVEVAAWVGA